MLLAIDTSTRMMSIAIATDTQILAEYSWYSDFQHTVQLAPSIVRLFADSGAQMHQLRAVAVAAGPGSFTGVRIGMALAKGIAMAHDLLLYAIPTLDIVAAGSPVVQHKTLVAVIPAGRGRALVRLYRAEMQQWRPVGDTALYDWMQLPALLSADSLLAGEISDKGLEVIAAMDSEVEVLSVAWRVRRASMMTQLLAAYPAQPPAAVHPIYLKEP